jgi:hypothetical protein
MVKPIRLHARAIKLLISGLADTRRIEIRGHGSFSRNSGPAPMWNVSSPPFHLATNALSLRVKEDIFVTLEEEKNRA